MEWRKKARCPGNINHKQGEPLVYDQVAYPGELYQPTLSHQDQLNCRKDQSASQNIKWRVHGPMPVLCPQGLKCRMFTLHINISTRSPGTMQATVPALTGDNQYLLTNLSSTNLHSHFLRTHHPSAPRMKSPCSSHLASLLNILKQNLPLRR